MISSFLDIFTKGASVRDPTITILYYVLHYFMVFEKKTLYSGFKDRSFNIFHFLFFIKSPFGMCRMLRTKCWTWNTCQLVNRITTLTYMETLKFSKVQVSRETENHLSGDSAKFVAKFHRSHLLLDSVNNWKVMYVLLLSCDALD